MATLKTAFGEFRGKRSDFVVQYLGIKYASLKDQLSAPEMVDRYESEVVDASEFGPKCIATDACEYEQTFLIQQRLEIPKSPPMSGLESLNLNITVPDIPNTRPLPVMVFIHGGGYSIGSNYWPQYDPARFVKLSIEQGRPVIVVNINYRLGVLGNLTSEELHRAGYPGNNSLRDQKCALQWIKFHIEGFGGDPENVTAFGESAGAISVLNQLYSEDPLFKRGISMSGTPIMLKPLPPSVTEIAYGKIMKELALENATAEERIRRLLTIEPDELVAKTPMAVPLLPYLDGEIIPTMASFEKLSSTANRPDFSIPGSQWCTDLMIGHCQHDGNVFMFMGLESRKAGIAAAFCSSLTKNLSSPAAAGAVLQAYKISPSTSDDEAMKALLSFTTDIAYYAPALAYARFWPGRTFYYQFNEPNPWDGPAKGLANHMLDAAFLFQNYNNKLSPEACEVAVELAKDFICFANGLPPWEEFNDAKGNVRIYGPSKTWITGMGDYNGWYNGRKDTLFKLQEEGNVDLDELSLAWDKFLAGQ
ncbi:carboxylesteras-like protein [Lindgomyces ingoldianus]|uniref:Carboxylesteras-like protein n=1 Tax=Lindgomyces ingoldianus TaxID=673940 RepID=A0ACB6QIG9_9PLEO|nr:carboxylesteras-like protein [Lindgomyces ingoldianus]KAF2466728.1 carboxylesteras-like protein [Lindgomyces ingoldianus]